MRVFYTLGPLLPLLGCALVLLALLLPPAACGGGYNKVRLTEVKTLTLTRGEMTTGRRSSPVQQLQCIYGGTVDCSDVYLPSVQCYNRGSNGLDVQWECKADMDANYRFGKIEVNCEGYEYPDDPYVLAGSCGLEYNVNYVKGGGQAGQKDYYSKYSSDNYGGGGGGGSSLKTWIVLLGFGALLYAFYKTCIGGGPGAARMADQRSRSNDDFHDQGRRPPPPPGWFSSGTQNNYPSDSSCGGGTGTGTGSCGTAGAGAGAGAAGGGGFWTGAATGGLLGYMFGARNNNAAGGGYGYGTGTGGGGGFFGGGNRGGGGWGGGGGGGSQPSTSSGISRSTSGFGGTRRR